MTQPYEKCPQFESCSCNKCPLDPNIKDREKVTGDSKCKARKAIRHRIGLEHKDILPNEGYTAREIAGIRLQEQIKNIVTV